MSRYAKFTPRAAKRIAAATVRVERSPIYSAESDRNRASGWAAQILRGKVTTAIPTGTLSTPSSSGRVQLLRKNPGAGWDNWGDPAPVWNDHTLSSSIPIDAVVKVAIISGELWLIAADCPP